DLLHAIAHCAPQLTCCWNRGRESIPLDFAERLVIGEEERLILGYRSSNTAAELILPEFRLHPRQRIPRLRHVEHILRVEFVIAQKIKERSMKRVCCRFCD